MTATEWNAYECVRRGIAGTRAELARIMDMSRPTASTVADSLIASGLLREGGKGRSSGGRHPILLLVRPDAFSLIGMDIGYRDRVSGVWIDAGGGVIKNGDIMMTPDNPERVAEAIARLWERFDPDLSAKGVGVAVSGVVKAGVVEKCAVAGFEGDGLMRALRKRFIGKYIYLAGRSGMTAYSEEFGGAANRERNFILLSLGQGISAAMYLNGQPFCGSHGRAGDLRRIPVPTLDGGGMSSLESVLSVDAIKGSGAAPDRIAAVCAEGLRQVVAILDVGMIVLAGRFFEFGEEFASTLERLLSGTDCRVRMAGFGRFSTARGVALNTYVGK